MKRELEQARELAKARIRSGNVPDWSWQHHVSLIEAIDSVLHDISMADDAGVPRRGHLSREQRIVVLPARARH